jgi:Fe-S-cluster-containing dehydrogenase component
VSWNKVLELENESAGSLVYVRNACMHCEDPRCIPSCPAEAIKKRPDGIVIIDQDECAGAGDCVEACPYGAISINPEDKYFPGEKTALDGLAKGHRYHEPGDASKCTMCVHRVEKGLEPACVVACPSQALIFGDLDDPASTISKKLSSSAPLLAKDGTHPKVTYIMPRNEGKQVNQRMEKNPAMMRF